MNYGRDFLTTREKVTLGANRSEINIFQAEHIKDCKKRNV